MTLFFQQLVEGLTNGAIYASLALALVFSFRSTHVVNFAQGEMAMLSTYVAWQLHAWGVPIWAAIGLALAISFVGGAGIYAALVRPMTHSSVLQIVTILIGLFIALNSLAGFIWGYLMKSFPDPFPDWRWTVGEVGINAEAVGIVLLLTATIGVLYLLLEHTKLGLGMRAAAAAPESSRLVGIPVITMLMIGWGIAAVLGALSGVMVAPSLFLDPNMMLGVIIYAFAAATLGGFDSVAGAVVGGLIVGIAETLTATYVPWIGADLKIVVALVIIFATLLIRPTGLFGREATARV